MSELLSYMLILTAVLTKTFNIEIKITKSGAVIKKANDVTTSSSPPGPVALASLSLTSFPSASLPC